MSLAIALATYNSERYLAELLESLLDQTVKDFVCYVHDDGSTDGTKEILKRYKDRFQKMVVLEYPPTGSAKANFLSMLKYVTEDYVMFCDHDDYWHKDKVEKSMKFIKKVEGNKPCLVFTDMNVVNDSLELLDTSFMNYTGLDPERLGLSQLIVQNVVPGCTSIMNKKLYQIVEKCSDTEKIRMHDQWAALVASASGTIYFLNESTLDYRQHISNVKGADADRTFLRKVLDMCRRFSSHTFVATNKEWHDMMTNQVEELARLPEISEQARRFCVGFVEVQNKPKLSRILFYLKNKIARNKDNIWLLLWC